MAQTFTPVPQHCSTTLDYALKFVLTNSAKHRMFKQHCRLKKDVKLERCFIWGKMRTAALEAADSSPISDSFERLLQSGSGRESIYKVLVKGEFNTMKHSFYKRFFVSHEDLISLDTRSYKD